MKIRKISMNDLNSQDEKMGVVVRCKLGAMHAMACDGAPLGAIMDMMQAIESFNATFWALCSLKSCGKLGDKVNEAFIRQQEEQLQVCLKDIEDVLKQCDEIRENKENNGVN